MVKRILFVFRSSFVLTRSFSPRVFSKQNESLIVSLISKENMHFGKIPGTSFVDLSPMYNELQTVYTINGRKSQKGQWDNFIFR